MEEKWMELLGKQGRMTAPAAIESFFS